MFDYLHNSPRGLLSQTIAWVCEFVENMQNMDTPSSGVKKHLRGVLLPKTRDTFDTDVSHRMHFVHSLQHRLRFPIDMHQRQYSLSLPIDLLHLTTPAIFTGDLSNDGIDSDNLPVLMLVDDSDDDEECNDCPPLIAYSPYIYKCVG
jgi:hypothetical protein